MHKMYMIIVFFGLVIMLVAAGCGDDEECASCPEPAPNPLGFAQGFIALDNGGTLMILDILGNGSGMLQPDSIRVGDSLVSRSEWNFYYNWALTDLYCGVTFEEDGNAVNYMYDHGDTATIEVWGNGRSSTCRVKILEYVLSAANITYPANDADTIAPGAADTIFWNYIEDVDYYACVVIHMSQPAGDPIVEYYFTSDTSFILTGDMYGNLETTAEIYVNPFNGPDPRSGRSNWTGNLLGGVVYSAGPFDYVSIHIIQPTKSAAVMPAKPEIKLLQLSPEEIVANLYKKYAR